VDESGFLLIPNVRSTWAPKGRTPIVYHLYKQDRISVISALAVSPRHRRVALYLRCRTRNLTGLDVRAFLSHLLRHLRGPVVLLWDQGTIHRRHEVQQFRRRHPRLDVHDFPAYAPELNPAESVWNQTDRALANGAPLDLAALYRSLRREVRRLRGSQKLLWFCIYASDLPRPCGRIFHYLCKPQSRRTSEGSNNLWTRGASVGQPLPRSGIPSWQTWAREDEASACQLYCRRLRSLGLYVRDTG
jgi:putative transposase